MFQEENEESSLNQSEPSTSCGSTSYKSIKLVNLIKTRKTLKKTEFKQSKVIRKSKKFSQEHQKLKVLLLRKNNMKTEKQYIKNEYSYNYFNQQ